jgi:Zn-dependent protease with chaperone function
MRLATSFVRLHRFGDRILAWGGCQPISDSSMADIRQELEDLEPDDSIGPVITNDDAPRLFGMLDQVARAMKVKVPREVRLSCLPACGIFEFNARPGVRRPVLVIGLPVLHIWSMEELGSVLAHELAHLRHRDIDFQREVLGWARSMRQRIDAASPHTSKFWRRRLAESMLTWVEYFARPVSRQMEFRADMCSADTIGSASLASALEKLAVVQPIFEEVISRADRSAETNIYRLLSKTWRQLRGTPYNQLRQKLVDDVTPQEDDLHPPVRQRIGRLRDYHQAQGADPYPSLHVLDNPSEIEQLLHNHLFARPQDRRSTFKETQG